MEIAVSATSNEILELVGRWKWRYADKETDARAATRGPSST